MGVLSEKLRERGHHVVPICSPHSEIFEDLSRRGFSPLPLAADGYFRPGVIRRLATWLRHNPADVIHLHYGRDLWNLVPAMRMARRVPVVLIKQIGTQKPKRDPLHRWLYAHVDSMIAISRVIHDNILATHPIPAERVELVHHGVDLRRFDPERMSRRAVRGELGIRSEELVIGIVGRLQRSKGHLELLAAAKHLAKEFDHVRFLIVGEPTRGEEAEAKVILKAIESSGLGSRVIVTGYRRDVPQMLGAMDVFVFPSHAEAFGLVLIEAMAMARPVVSSNCDGVLDIVVDGETGFLVPPRDVAALTAAIRRLVVSPQMRHQLGWAGRQRVQERFDIEHTIDRVEAIYDRVCSVSPNRRAVWQSSGMPRLAGSSHNIRHVAW